MTASPARLDVDPASTGWILPSGAIRAALAAFCRDWPAPRRIDAEALAALRLAARHVVFARVGGCADFDIEARMTRTTPNHVILIAHRDGTPIAEGVLT